MVGSGNGSGFFVFFERDLYKRDQKRPLHRLFQLFSFFKLLLKIFIFYVFIPKT